MASGNKLPERVVVIMADCGFTSPHEIWEHVVKKNLHISYKIRKNAVERICHKHMKVKPSEYSTILALKQNTLPILFVHGADDHFVPIEMTYANYRACTAPKHLLVVPEADHGMSYFINPQEYEACSKNFWLLYDEKIPQKDKVQD